MKWEYLILSEWLLTADVKELEEIDTEVNNRYPGIKTKTIFNPAALKIYPKKGLYNIDFLNFLGTRGWEMVSNEGSGEYVFKRLLPDGH